MPILKISTEINAPIELCFNLSRSIDLHRLSTPGSQERAIAGVTSGLIGMGEEVTWEATHFMIRQQLTSRITGFDYPTFFRDEMIQGPFRMIQHDHCFEAYYGMTWMHDRFEFVSPMGKIGRIVDQLFLTRYMEKLIIRRNQIIKDYAESGKWKLILT